MEDTPLEASPEDVADQHAEVVTAVVDDRPEGSAQGSAEAVPDVGAVPWDADPADVAEQQAEVPLGDDDWA